MLDIWIRNIKKKLLKHEKVKKRSFSEISSKCFPEKKREVTKNKVKNLNILDKECYCQRIFHATLTNDVPPRKLGIAIKCFSKIILNFENTVLNTIFIWLFDSFQTFAQ